ncbi:MAG: hypothetical protein A2176_08640 [Spirochaetes bacterium RBG_13_51_14]|nr:MAG: hypothetical protein A2176_08640 [Spirochaetes bacterium RBG_13_51_14]
MYLTDFALSILFTYIFTKGYENRGIMEGVRYGLIIGLLMDGIGSFGQYMVYPIPLTLALQWFVYGVIRFIILGIIVSLIYRPKTG